MLDLIFFTTILLSLRNANFASTFIFCTVLSSSNKVYRKFLSKSNNLDTTAGGIAELIFTLIVILRQEVPLLRNNWSVVAGALAFVRPYKVIHQRIT